MRWLHDLLQPSAAKALLHHIQPFTRTPVSLSLTHGDHPLPILCWPLVLSAEETKLLRRTSETVIRGLEAFTRQRIRSESLEGMGLSPLQQNFVQMESGYRPSIPVARMDAYWTPSGPKLLEVNTDGTAYIDYADRLNGHALSILGPFIEPPAARFESHSIRGALLKTLLSAYREFCGTHGRRVNPRPLVGIMDYRDVKTSGDQENVSQFMGEQGIPSRRIDPRDLAFRSGRLLHRGTPIDIVYRRATSREIFARPQDFKAFLQAYRSGAVCVVGSFRSDIGFHKASLRWALDALPKETSRQVKAFVPEILSGDLATHGLRTRDSFLFKPWNRNQGKGIRLGSSAGAKEWASLVRKAERGQGALQKVVRPPSVHLPRELGLSRHGPLRLNLGLFVLGGCFAGVCARLTPDLILREESPEWLVPVFCRKSGRSQNR